MDIKEFSARMKAQKQQLDDLFNRKMPVFAGRMAKDHYQDSFRNGGFTDSRFTAWKKSRRLESGGKDAGSKYGTLLSSRNLLFGAIKYVPGNGRVKVSNDLVYAPAHNWGETVCPTVTLRMRKFAWAKYYESGGGKKKSTQGSNPVEDPEEAVKWKKLALTKKKKLSIKMPQRQFLGESQVLNDKIEKKTDDEVRKILNM